MAENNMDVDVDLHPSRATILSLYEQKWNLILENETYRAVIGNLEFTVRNQRADEMILLRTIERLEKNLTEEELRSLMKDQQLVSQQQKIDALQLHLEQSETRNIEPFEDDIQRLQKRLQDSELQNKLLLNENNKMNQIMISVISASRAMYDENRRLKSRLSEVATVIETDMSMTRRCGRFVIKKRCLECVNCHQSFDSKSQMEISDCCFHPARPIKVNKCYYWKCCGVEDMGGSSPGCKEGRHVSKPD